MEGILRKEIQMMMPLVDGIAQTLGKNCEVVLHDFSKLPESIVAIANGHVTGRSIGSPQTEHSLSIIKSKHEHKDKINYQSKTVDGKILRSSSFFIRDENGEAIGVLCINIDLTSLSAVNMLISEMLSFEKPKEADDINFPTHVNEILNKIVEQTVENAASPVAYLSKEHKVDIVKQLDEQGAFLIKGSIDYVAEVLCVSRYTIYNYLVEIRGE